MTFADLVTELKNRGFSDLTDARAGVYINAAWAEFDRQFLWPWREKSVTGTPPVTVSDLGRIERVVDTTTDRPLERSEYRHLVDLYGDLSVTGTPHSYYLAWPSAAPVVATYPMGTGEIGIQYWRSTPTLTGSDEPAAPDDVHYLVVDLAVRRAYRASDNHEQAEAVQSEIDHQLDSLFFQYLPGFPDGSDRIRVVNAGEWA